MARPTVIVIYAPTRKYAHALRDALADAFETLDLPDGIRTSETHWIGVGEDSATDTLPKRDKRADNLKRPAKPARRARQR